MKEWQFNVLFWVGVLGAVATLFAPTLGLDLAANPLAVTGMTTILTFVLTQKQSIIKKKEPEKEVSDAD